MRKKTCGWLFFVAVGLSFTQAYAQDSKKLIDTLTYETQLGLPIAASKIYFTDSKFALSGFAESNYIHYLGEKNKQSEDLELYMTNLQRFVMYAAYKPKKWLVVYAEIFAEFMNDGRHEHRFEFQPEVFLDFLIDDAFNFRVGSHQLRLGFINNNDEPVMFYSVNRPEVERLIVPSSWIDLGVMTYGKIGKNLSWSASVYQAMDPMNLRGASWLRQGRADVLRFNFEGYTLNTAFSYSGIKNTDLAMNGMFGSLGKEDMRSSTYIISSYARTEFKNFTLMALGAFGGTTNPEALFDLTQQYTAGGTGQVLGSKTYGYYGELGYDVWSLFRKKGGKPISNFFMRSSEIKLPLFLRYERLNTHAQIDESLRDFPAFQTDLTAITMGLNFNPRRSIVFKCNYQFRNNRAALPGGLFEGDRFEVGLGLIF
jgi:hypothetical protein